MRQMTDRVRTLNFKRTHLPFRQVLRVLEPSVVLVLTQNPRSYSFLTRPWSSTRIMTILVSGD